MKKLLLFIIGIVFLSMAATSTPPKSDLDDSNSDDILCQILPDSIYTLVKNKPSLLYSYGHYGYSWSLITKIDNRFLAFSGRVNYSGDHFITEPTEVNRFDSILLFSKYRNLLNWGLDTISTEINKMKISRLGPYTTMYTDLTCYNSDGIRTFNSAGNVTFSGPDSLEFNHKFHKICLLMWWISSYEIRKCIPDSVIF